MDVQNKQIKFNTREREQTPYTSVLIKKHLDDPYSFKKEFDSNSPISKQHKQRRLQIVSRSDPSSSMNMIEIVQ